MDNLLDKWKDFILNFKWSNPEIADKIDVNEVDSIYYSLNDFFSNNDFNITAPNNSNWIVHLLKSLQPSSFFLLKNYTRWFDFYKTLTIPEQNSFGFKKKRQKGFNYEVFRDKLFELETNYILKINGLSPVCNKSYTNSDGNTQKLDSWFKFKNEEYLIECKKIHSKNFEVFYNLIINITQHLEQRNYLKSIHDYELVAGFIGFKSDNIITHVNNAEKELFEYLTNYFEAVEDSKKDEIFIPNTMRSNNPTYDIVVEPNYSDKYSNEYEKVSSLYDFFIKFRTWIPDVKTMAKKKADVSMKIKYKMVSRFVANKLKEKIEQHKSWNSHKIFFIEIENIEIPHKDGYSIPLSKENLDINEFSSMLNDKISMVFIFKTLNKNGLKTDIGFLKKDNFDNDLSDILENLKI